MINLANNALMMIEPQSQSQEQVYDKYSEYAKKVLEACTEGQPYRGFHMCICGEMSDNVDHFTKLKRITNSLLPHYVIAHRSEIPQSELDKLKEEYLALGGK